VSGLDHARSRIAAAARAAGRSPEAVRLVVVTKGQSVEVVNTLYQQGQRDFAENRAQELAAKVGLLPADITWHFVGPLQTNKVRLVRPVASLLHSLDRLELAAAWVKGPGTPPPALVQVRLGGETTKQGVEPAEALTFARQASDLGIEIAGLMTIPPPLDDPEVARSHFRQLALLGTELMDVLPAASALSMGMSDDYELAIAAGATIVRVGRAIFGPVPN